jgi:hypothetical protein
MNSQQLLLINFLILSAVVLFFVFGRSKGKQTLKLDLRSPSQDKAPPLQKEAESLKVAETSVVAEETKDVIVTQPQVISAPQVVAPAENSIFFVYNGHEWEAHEVLGLGKSCDLKDATMRYQSLIKTSDPSTFEFYDAAYSAILKKLTSV